MKFIGLGICFCTLVESTLVNHPESSDVCTSKIVGEAHLWQTVDSMYEINGLSKHYVMFENSWFSCLLQIRVVVLFYATNVLNSSYL